MIYYYICHELIFFYSMENKQYYTIKEFADAVGVAVITVRGWIRSGKIKAEKTRVNVGFKEIWIIPKDEAEKVKI